MKSNLENSIKESLRDFEMPYDPAAWTSLSSRLDNVMPSTPKSNLKWYLGGAATIVIVATTITFWPSNSETKKADLAKIEDTKVEDKSPYTAEKLETTSSSGNIQKENSTKTSFIQKQNDTNKQFANSNSNSNGATFKNPETVTWTAEKPSNKTENPTNGNSINPENKPLLKEILVPEIGNICIGETVNISNTNDVDLIVTDAAGNRKTIPSNRGASFTPEAEGPVKLSYTANGSTNTTSLFTVHSRPKADFQIDDAYEYENGLPTTIVKATTSGMNYSWEVEKLPGTISGKEATLHFFHKGNFDITLKVTGSNGCSVTETKTVTIDKEYNLLAVNAFDPNSSDIRKNSFMPYALTQRSVDFRMIIIDPSDGAIIFESNDASNPWRGLDKRNGQMVDANKAYIWKVVLNNPVKGEYSEYKGTITRL